MITFDVELKVLTKESKSIARKDGNGTFDFTEVKLETTDKKPTVLIARLANNDMEVSVGCIYNMKVGISSTLTSTGKLFTNFVVLAHQYVSGAKESTNTPTEVDIDDLPF